MSHAAARTGLALFAFACVFGLALAVDPPDLRINTLTGMVETVDATWSGTNFNVRYTIANGVGQNTATTLLTTHKANDLDPRIALSTTGSAYVSWWRDTTPNQVLYRVRSLATGLWGSERLLGYSSEANSRPRMAFVGTRLWVVYLIQSAKSRSLASQIIDDDPEPVRKIVASTTYTGDLDSQLLTESGHLWVSWIDSTSRVGWSEYDFAKADWSVPAYESYSLDSVSDARARIRQTVLGL